jgi:hypothetical protein
MQAKTIQIQFFCPKSCGQLYERQLYESQLYEIIVTDKWIILCIETLDWLNLLCKPSALDESYLWAMCFKPLQRFFNSKPYNCHWTCGLIIEVFANIQLPLFFLLWNRTCQHFHSTLFVSFNCFYETDAFSKANPFKISLPTKTPSVLDLNQNPGFVLNLSLPLVFRSYLCLSNFPISRLYHANGKEISVNTVWL